MSKYSSRVYGLGNLHERGNGYLARIVGRKHPRADARGRVAEHIIVAETVLGHYLALHNVVHHINGNPKDNRPCNLVVCENEQYHQLLHQRARAYRATGDVTKRICLYCSKWMSPTDPDCCLYQFTRVLPGYKNWPRARSWHISCRKVYAAAQYQKRKVVQHGN